MGSGSTILDKIMEQKRAEVTAKRSRVSEAQLLLQSKEQSAPRGFAQTLIERVGKGEVAIIAEVKRASPSKGVIHPLEPFDPVGIGVGYAEHGAACISCLTDAPFFQGEDGYLAAIRGRVSLPVLRKDFVYDPYQVVESRALGADAILLIMALLSNQQAEELEAAAREIGLDVLVEVHNGREFDAAHRLTTPLLGINNRDLKTFVTSLETTVQLAERAEAGRLVVSESGIDGPAAVQRLRGHGVHAFLIGETFMKEPQPGEALGRFLAGLNAA